MIDENYIQQIKDQFQVQLAIELFMQKYGIEAMNEILIDINTGLGGENELG